MNLTIAAYNAQRVCILGFSREGQATLRALQRHAPGAQITIADQNTGLSIPAGLDSQLGQSYLERLDDFDVIIKSPGIPPSPALQAVSGKTVTATQLFFAAAQRAGAEIVGVTGSKGKSTTSALIFAALKAGGQDVELVGNIGKPMLDYLDQLGPGRRFVAELSSYQLQDLPMSPQVAVVTSFFPEHLSYHGTLANYLEAKKHITRFQTANDYVFYNGQSPECAQIAQESTGHRIAFAAEDFPLPITQTKLLGQHNRSNLAAAYKVAMHCGVNAHTTLEALKNFEGLPHRLQSLGVHGGIEWVDDSFSTAPDATLAALRALEGRVDTLIVGGVDRGYTFDELGRYLASDAGASVRTIILFPDTGAAIQNAIESNQPPQPKAYFPTDSMAVAVDAARQHTATGKICLLSSGAPSFNLFKDFEDRGQQFAVAVRQSS